MNIKEINSNISIKELIKYLSKQLSNFFPDNLNYDHELSSVIPESFERTLYCFRHIKSKYFNDENFTYFNYLNGDQYCMFIFFSSRVAFLKNYEGLYLKLSLLNKHLFSLDLFGHIDMPDIFLLVHPIGSIFGRAKYENYFVAYQGVTIGGVHKTATIDYPILGEQVVCYANSIILGDTEIGDNVIIGANSFIVNGKIDSNCTVKGIQSNIRITPLNSSVKDLFFL